MIGSTNATARRRPRARSVSSGISFPCVVTTHRVRSAPLRAGAIKRQGLESGQSGVLFKNGTTGRAFGYYPLKDLSKIRVGFCGTLDALSALGQPPVELGEGCGHHADFASPDELTAC